MSRFDSTLKVLLPGSLLIRKLADAGVREWLNVELPAVRAPKVDLLAWLENALLFHLELQSFNDPDIAMRMLEYYIRLWREFLSPPVQTVLYIGSEPMRMDRRVRHRNLLLRYSLVDIREFDSEEFLASPRVEDSLLAVLCRVRNQRLTIKRILERIATATPSARADLVAQLLVLSGLRNAENIVREEGRHMPVIIDPMKNAVLREWYEEAHSRGVAEGELRGEKRGELRGEKRGERRGEKRGELQGRRSQLKMLLQRRFGPLPAWAADRLSAAERTMLDEWSLRIFDAVDLEQVFTQK